MVIVVALAGMLLLIPLVLFFSIFVENILFLDSLIAAILFAVWLRTVTGIHPVFCILSGVALLIVLMMLYMQCYLFWIFTSISTFMWGYMSALLLHDITNDWIWGIFLGMVAGAIVLMLHMYVRYTITG